MNDLCRIALEVTDEAKAEGKRIVVANGVFDLLHPGHAGLLFFAKQQGNFLIVAINSDESTRRLKGPDRPIWSVEWRRRMVWAIRWVDAIMVFEDDTPARLLQRLQPDVLVKGQDTPRPWPGEEFCGECIAAPYLNGFSTTAMAERMMVSRLRRWPKG